MRVLALACVVVVSSLPALAQSNPTLITLRWADASLTAALLNNEQPPPAEELHACRQRWVDGFAARVARAVPNNLDGVSPKWYYASTLEVAPREQISSQGNLAALRPRGVDSIVAIEAQNALLVSGTAAGIDQLREVLAMLDVKPRMVSIEAALLDNPTSVTDEWGIDFATQMGNLLIARVGAAPSSGLQGAYRRGNTRVVGGWNRETSQGQTLTAASVTTTNNIPALLSVGRMLPYTNTQVSYDYYGNRRVTYEIDAVFIGTELFVQPRINGDDSVTMVLRPTFVEAAGTLIAPNGVSLPITDTVSTQTVVTVPDGQTIQIGGFERSRQEYSTRFGGLLSGQDARTYSHPRLFVTPHIVRDVPELGH